MEVPALLAELKVCSSTKNLRRGKAVHAEAKASGKDSYVCIATALVKMYAKCGRMGDARSVFDRIAQPDVVSWTTLISGYAETGQGVTALDLFERMKSQGCAPDRVSFLAALKACAHLAKENDACLERVRRIHGQIGNNVDIYVQNTLINIYAKCGSMSDARRVFDEMKFPNVVSWTALILGYAENGQGVTALDMFSRMKSQGCAPDSICLVACLKSCTSLALDQGREECLKRGTQIHSEIGSHSNMFVQNTLIDMYAKCGSMQQARQVFESLNRPDVVSYNALIMGYAENGQELTALDVYGRMKAQRLEPDYITFVAALKASGSLGDLESGTKVHAEIRTAVIEQHAILVTCLVDFYANCANVLVAQEVFDSHPRSRDLTTWNALCAGYSRLGDWKSAFSVFEGMQDAGYQPNHVTFLSILACCRHAGLVEKASEFFAAMLTKHGVTPTIEHYTCMVGIFGCWNKLSDAMALVRGMLCGTNAITWVTVLGACRRWNNLGVAKLAFKSLVSLDERNSQSYVVMAHLYRSRGMRDEHEMVLDMRRKFRACKDLELSCWFSEVGNSHSFCVGDESNSGI